MAECEGAVDGDGVAEMPAKAKLSLDGKKIDATVDVPRVDFAHVRKIVPGLPLVDLAAAHAEVHGTLDEMQATAHTEFGKGIVDAKADIKLGDAVAIDGAFTLGHVDARAFVATAPKTDVNANGKAAITLKNGGFSGTYDIDIAKGSVADQVTPTANVKGTMSEKAIVADLRVDEPGAPTTAHAKLDLAKNVLAFTTQTDSPGIEAIPQLKRMVHGRAAVSTKGTLNLASQTIDATFDVTGGRVSTNGVTARTIKANGRVAGPLTTPTIIANVHGQDVVAGGMKVETVDAGAKVDIDDSAITVRDADVDLCTADEHVKVHADRVVSAGGGIKVDGATIDGLGTLIGIDLEERNGLVAASIHAHNADLAKIGKVVGAPGIQGVVSVNADVRLTSNDVKGRIDVDVRRATVGPIDRLSAHVDSTLLGHGLIANVHVDSPSLGRIDVNTSTIKLAGTPLAAKSWTEATGDAQIDGEIELKKLLAYLPKDSLTDLDGKILIDGEIKRSDPTVVPSVEIDATTQHLRVVKSPQVESHDVDIAVVAKIDGHALAEVDARLVDEHGDLITMATTLQLSNQDLIALRVPIRTLFLSPITLDVEIPQRRIATLPKALGLGDTQGKIGVSLQGTGTAFAPKLKLVTRFENLRTPDVPVKLALTGIVGATYDGSVVDVTGAVSARKEQILAVDAKAHVLWRDLLILKDKSTLPWDASAHAVLTNLPIRAVQALADRSIKGSLSGEVSVTDLHKNARASVQLSIDDLKVGRDKYRNAYVRGSVDAAGAFSSFVRIDQTDGWLNATLNGGLRWGSSLTPSSDATKSWVAAVDAKSFNIGVALPFIDSYLNQLEGRLDAHAIATIPPNAEPKVDGTISLRKGVIQSPIVGEEFHDISFDVKLAPNGNDTLATADKIVAYGTTGKLLASANARMHGVNFAGANLNASIGKDQPIQLTMEGQDYGEGYGQINVTIVKPNPTQTTVKITVPSFHVTIPQISTRSLQELEPAEQIRIGVRSADGGFRPLVGHVVEPVAPSNSRLDLDFTMGKDVDVKVGDLVRVQMEGGPHVTVTDKSVVTGQIRLRGGTLDVQGKQFDIQDGGTITFTGGDPGNPDVVVTALWPAPDGTRVFADFNGPLKTGKVTLRAEPAKTQNDILALILFGSADAAGGTATESGGVQAASTAGGFATRGLSQAIADTTGLDATVRIDTSEQNNPKPEVRVQITRTIAIELQTVLGQPPYGANPDTNFFQVDWRFAPRWSLDTTFGNKGSTILDVLWQYRY
ncbi:MAG: translocation/assembly module TamB domain-containing protein [Polyangiaceae bacterium]